MSHASMPQTAGSAVSRGRPWGVGLPRRGANSRSELCAIGRSGRALKRSLDMVGALIGLALCVLPVLLIALLLKLIGGLELVSETRVGMGGRCFRAYRLRVGRGWWGHWWRRLGLDRSLWLINVLRGEMSLVGPWPERVAGPDEASAEAIHPDRQRVRPGLCGWAQINGISRHAPAALSLEYDLYYIRNWSLWLDLFILAVAPFRLFVREHGP